MTHTLEIRFHKNGTGFSARSSCGKSFGRATGCNRGGIDYGLVATWQDYRRHCAKVGADPVMHEACKDLAGVEAPAATAT